MAFLDETGLAELWSLVKAQDSGVTTAMTALANTKAKIATGSYTGTGTGGESNPNSLTFSFAPKFVFIIPQSSNSDRYWGAFIPPANVGLSSASDSAERITNCSLSGNTLSWYYYQFGVDANTTATRQLNQSGVAFQYVAIG